MEDAKNGNTAHDHGMELLGIAATFVGLAFLAALPLMALLLLAETGPDRKTPRNR